MNAPHDPFGEDAPRPATDHDAAAPSTPDVPRADDASAADSVPTQGIDANVVPAPPRDFAAEPPSFVEAPVGVVGGTAGATGKPDSDVGAGPLGASWVEGGGTTAPAGSTDVVAEAPALAGSTGDAAPASCGGGGTTCASMPCVGTLSAAVESSAFGTSGLDVGAASWSVSARGASSPNGSCGAFMGTGSPESLRRL